MKILRDVVMELKVDVLHVTETRDSAATLSPPTDTWSCHPSTRGIKSQGAATLTRLEVSKASSDTNVSLVQVKWEKKTLWVITAYFPNELPDTIATVKAVDAMLRQKHGARVILVGDFNSMETLDRSSTGGPPSTGQKELHVFSNSLTNGDSRMAGFNPRTPTEMGRETTSPTSHTGTMKGPGGSG